MSREPATPNGAAHEIQMDASRWVIERASENWTGEDQAALDVWLNKSTAHAVAYWRANHAWSRTYRIAALKRPAQEEVPQESGNKFGVHALRGAAAVCALAIFALAASSFTPGPKFTRYATPVGGHKILALSDGSRIELNTDSVLRLADGADGRQVILDKGEAYFEVRHNSARPFVVQAGGRKIIDVGTKFLVRDGGGHLEVALFEGRVLLGAPEGSKSAPSNLTAGDVAIATTITTSIARQSPQVLASEMSWRQGVLVFHHTALADAAAEFNRYNAHKLIVTDRDSARLKIDGKFRTNDVKGFVEVAEDVLGLRVEKQNSQTVMSR